MAKDAIELRERIKKPEGENRVTLQLSVKKYNVEKFGLAYIKKEMQAKLEAWIEEKSAIGKL
jgi:hypothetical protein